MSLLVRATHTAFWLTLVAPVAYLFASFVLARTAAPFFWFQQLLDALFAALAAVLPFDPGRDVPLFVVAFTPWLVATYLLGRRQFMRLEA